MNITIYICCYTGIQAPHCTTLGALLLAMLLYARRSRTSFSHAVGSLTATCTWTLVGLPCCHVHLDPRVRLNNHNLPPGQAPELPRVSGPGAVPVQPHVPIPGIKIASTLPSCRVGSEAAMCHRTRGRPHAATCSRTRQLASPTQPSRGPDPELLRVSGTGVGSVIITLSGHIGAGRAHLSRSGLDNLLVQLSPPEGPTPSRCMSLEPERAQSSLRSLTSCATTRWGRQGTFKPAVGGQCYSYGHGVSPPS
jgi:hypothetical protein